MVVPLTEMEALVEGEAVGWNDELIKARHGWCLQNEQWLCQQAVEDVAVLSGALSMVEAAWKRKDAEGEERRVCTSYLWAIRVQGSSVWTPLHTARIRMKSKTWLIFNFLRYEK